MELQANTHPTTSTELEHMEKEQPLGEGTNLGRPGVETTDAIATAVRSGPAEFPARAAITRFPAAARTTSTPGGTATIRLQEGKTREGRRRTGWRTGWRA